MNNEPATESYYTLSGIHVRKGQTEEEARKERDEYNLRCGIQGSPSYGGWHRNALKEPDSE